MKKTTSTAEERAFQTLAKAAKRLLKILQRKTRSNQNSTKPN